ncbi:type I inositol 3,4-bisphosphate 4-phosphatase-like [Bombyx mandarina]|uniref:phosphatidylinositol-3,4-bisphosphate 4-phosphatase n=1 Tax=Bombyx mandarina TaxID=7092 RepID=A0A6J2K5D4_BOMMA|nr:type I inositol 3,4-bisphosphate 4-phosphatase-like [Bombyx mandarina]
MRYNKQELVALASQTSQNFDREGVLVMRERQDGFFRRSEGSTVRWFRLRGNLLFYLKGPEPWYEPMGVIILGNHQVKLQSQDENGHWPFQIVWDSGVSYRMATFLETERTLWLKAIQLASYDNMHSRVQDLKDRLNAIRPVIDITNYRLQKGIFVDMNEVPICELALSCDNLLCDAHGKPPSPMVVIYAKNPKGPCIEYGSTEVVEMCSNPSFSKTILFRASDGLNGDTMIRLVVYDVKEPVSDTTVPMGFTSMKLSMIQEAQRLRVSLCTKEEKTIGFVTLNGWSLEPSYTGTSPVHSNDRSIEIPQKVLCHRRSQSLPPRLGLKLKFPSYGSLIKQNFLNSHQVTYRFQSGLGGDITVHEIMTEPKICFSMPVQLLNIYIERERELLEELLSVGEICSQWQNRQLELVSNHVGLLKHYGHAKKCMESIDDVYFKASCRKDDASLEFAPVNLHLQRMWVHNDTLNKTGFHDIVTAGAFAAHTHKTERSGGLIRLVQHVKDINSSKAELQSITNKIQVEYDNVVALRRLRDELSGDMDRIIMLLQAKQIEEVQAILDGIKNKAKSILALWDPTAVEETLSYIGWPKDYGYDESDGQTMSTILRLTEQMNLFEAVNSDCETLDVSSSSSSKEASPTEDDPSTCTSEPSMSCDKKNPISEEIEEELQFHNDYFKTEREERISLNNSFRSVRSAKTTEPSHSLDSTKTRHGSLRYDFKSSASLEQVSYRCLVNNNKVDKRKTPQGISDALDDVSPLDQTTRDNNFAYLKAVGTAIEEALASLIRFVVEIIRTANGDHTEEQMDVIRAQAELLKKNVDGAARWLRVSHAALRLRCEAPLWARENAVLQTRRDTCFSQALTTVTSGLLCWLCSVPSDVVVKLLSSGLGPLCGFEGLLSLYSNEKAMWGDMVVAVEDLQTVVFQLCKVGHGNPSVPQVTGARGALVVKLPVSESLYSKFDVKEHLSFTITAVFFNIGINEKASLAEALGETIPQYHSNSDNLDRLNKYYHKFCKVFPQDLVAITRGVMTFRKPSSRSKPLEEVMENLRISVHKKVPRNYEVIQLASMAVRQMNGVRFTSCKSAKDRTGMSVTLEQCSILASEYHLAENEVKKALDIMRSEGCRRANTQKNIGVRKYAFTKKQVMTLPGDYRPPAGTYGITQT